MKKRLFNNPLSWLLVLLAAFLFTFLPASAARAATLRLPTGLTMIEEQAFYGNTSLDEVIVPEGVTEIGSEAFAGCGIKIITLPITLNSIANDAFTGCDDMTVRAHEGSYAYSWAVEHQYYVVDSQEPAGEMTVYAPDTLTAGKNLKVKVVGTANTLHQSIYITDEATGAYQSRQFYEPTGTAEFPGYFFEGGKTYRLAIYTVTNEFQTLTPIIKRIRVTGQKPAAPVLELPESMTLGHHYWIERGEYTSIQMELEYYSETGKLFAKDEGWGDVNTYRFSEIGEGGTIKVRYAAEKNGIWSEWSGQYSIAVVLPQYLAGDINFPDTIENGSDFTIQFSYTNNPYFCYGYFYPKASTHIYYEDSKYLNNESGTVSMQLFTPEFEPGEYTFKLLFRTEMSDITTLAYQKDFEIVGTRAAAPVVACDNTELLTNSYASFVIDTHDVDAIKVKKKTPYTIPDIVSFVSQGESTMWRDYYYDIGTHTYQFSVLKNEKWSDWTNTIEIQVKKRPKLELPIIHIPSIVNAGEDLVFSFEEVENASYYEVDVIDIYDNNSLSFFDKNTAIPNTELTVPGCLLSAGQYRIGVWAYSDEYATSNVEGTMIVRGTKPNGPGFTAESYPCIESHAVFSVNTENAESLQVRRMISDEYDAERFNRLSGETIPVIDDMTQWDYYISSSSEGKILIVAFSVKVDGIWSDWSTESYEIAGKPPLDPAEIHIPENIEAGADFTITIDSVENATEYEYGIYLTDDDKALLYDSSYNPFEEIYIGGYEFDPGEYTIKAWAYSEDYVNSENEEFFTITGTKAPAPSVSVDKTEVNPDEDFTFTIDTSDAALLFVKDEWGNSSLITTTGDSTRWSDSCWEAGERYFQFTVYKDGKWTEWSDPICIVAEDKPSLEVPEVYIPESMTAGGDYIFSFSSVENAASYRVFLAYPYNENNTIYELGSGAALPDTELTLPGYLINHGNYVLSVSAYAEGYSPATKTIRLSAAGSRPAGPEITVEEPLRIKSTVTFAIDTENAEALQVNYQYTSPNNNWSKQSLNIPVTGDTTQWPLQIDSYKEGVDLTVSFSARVNGIWSAWRTNTYTIAGLPPLDPAVIHVDDTIQAGSDFRIAIDPVENATSYEYELYKPDGNTSWDSFSSSSAKELFYYGYEIEPGEYRIKVWAYSNDYATSISEKTFSITGERPDAPTVSVDKETARVNEYCTFTIDTSNAERLRYSIYDYSSNYIYVLEDETQWTTYFYSSGSYECRFAVKRNGIWSAWSEPIEITVTTNPSPEAPEISVLEPIGTGRDLVIALSAVENATSYHISVGKTDDTLVVDGSVNPEKIGGWAIPGYRITPGQYVIKAYALNGDSRSEETQTIITVPSSARPAAPSVIVPENTVFNSSTYVKFTIDTTDAELVMMRYFTVGNTNNISYGSMNLEEGQESFTWNVYFYGSSKKYSFAVLKDGVWSEWSDFTTITMSE